MRHQQLWVEPRGRNLVFWEDLSAAKLIPGGFTTATDAGTNPINSNFGLYFPEAKMGNGNYIYVYSAAPGCLTCSQNTSVNYYSISVPTYINAQNNLQSNLGLTVNQAYMIDLKMDDGLPLGGRIIAQYDSGGPQDLVMAPNAAADSASTCYNTTTNKYSLTINNGTGLNCALSFQFQ